MFVGYWNDLIILLCYVISFNPCNWYKRTTELNRTNSEFDSNETPLRPITKIHPKSVTNPALSSAIWNRIGDIMPRMRKPIPARDRKQQAQSHLGSRHHPILDLFRKARPECHNDGSPSANIQGRWLSQIVTECQEHNKPARGEDHRFVATTIGYYWQAGVDGLEIREESRSGTRILWLITFFDNSVHFFMRSLLVPDKQSSPVQRCCLKPPIVATTIWDTHIKPWKREP
jgi:hypothetical protein